MKICSKCENKEDNSQIFQCDSCKSYLCETCGDISATEIRCLQMKKRRLLFICPECDQGLRQVPLLVKKINELQNQLDEMKTLVDKLTSGQSPSQNQRCDDIMLNEQLIQELNERQSRSSNVIMLNIAESGKSDRNARIDDDTMKVKEIIELTETAVNNVKVYRLGKYVEGKTRPLKVVLPDQSCALSILKNRSKVTNISIFGDKTKMQQDFYKNVRAKLEELKQQGDNNKIIKYINNIPTIVDKKQYTQKN